MDGKYFMCPGTYLDCEQTVLWCVVIQAIKSTLETTIKQRGAARKAAFSTQPCSVCLLHALLVQALCSPFPGNTLLTTQMTITVSHWMILCWFLRRKISWRKAALDLPRLACSEERALCLGMSSLRPKHSQCMGKGAHPPRCWVPLVPKSACCLKRSGRSLRFASFLPPSLNRDPQPGFTALWWWMQLFLWQPHYSILVSKSRGYWGCSALYHMPGTCTSVLQVPLQLS